MRESGIYSFVNNNWFCCNIYYFNVIITSQNRSISKNFVLIWITTNSMFDIKKLYIESKECYQLDFLVLYGLIKSYQAPKNTFKRLFFKIKAMVVF